MKRNLKNRPPVFDTAAMIEWIEGFTRDCHEEAFVIDIPTLGLDKVKVLKLKDVLGE